MITVTKYYTGSSTDSKPNTDTPPGSIFLETDTKQEHVYNDSDWVIKYGEEFDRTIYPVRAQGTADGVQYDSTGVSTVTSGENVDLWTFDTADYFPRLAGTLAWVHYDIDLELEAANTTADLIWQLQAKDNSTTGWTNMCTARTETDVGTTYASRSITGYLDIQDNINLMPFEMKLILQSSEGTAKIVDAWAQTDAVNFADTIAILAVYYFNSKLIAGLQITTSARKTCPYYDLDTEAWVDTGEILSSGDAKQVRCFAEFESKLFLGNENQINYTSDGASWAQVFNQPDNIYSLAVFKTKFYAAQGNGQIFVAAENAHQEASWGVTTHDPTDATCCYALIDFDDKLFVGTTPNGNVFYSADGGDTAWVPTGDLENATHVYCFAKFNTGNGDELYAGTEPNGKVFKYNTAGNSWSLVGTLTDATKVRSLVVIENKLYAGTEAAGNIYYSSDGENWTPAKDLTGATAIYGMVKIADRVWVGANGNKLWYSDLVSGEGTGKVKNTTVIQAVGDVV
ncbi:hypothetical protein ES708_17783 [subsurface metagenome]